MRTTNKLYISDLIRIDIHKLVNEDGCWERRIGNYQIALVPDRWGTNHFLQLFVNNFRVDKTFELSSQPHRGWLQRNGFIPYHHDTIWYVVGSNQKRYRYLYIHPERMQIGTRDEHQAIYSQRKMKLPSRAERKRMEAELFKRDEDFAACYRKKKEEWLRGQALIKKPGSRVPRACYPFGPKHGRNGAVKRREFIRLLGGAAVAWPLAGNAQQPVPVIGFLGAPTAKGREASIAAFGKGLTEVGYTEGRNIVIEYRWAEGQFDRLTAMANELVQRKVAVIVAFTTPAGLAAKAATSTIPIVLLTGDPVGTGLVASLSRPGGNITGLSYVVPETHGKCVEVLQDMLPSVQRVAALGNAADPSNKQILDQIQLAGQSTGIKIEPILMVSGPDQFDAAFAKMAQERSDGVVVQASLPPKAIADLALKYRLPVATSFRQYAEAGGLVSYGALESDLWRRSAIFIHKILQGSKPADLPVEQAVKFELVVNLTTAKALGLAIPQTFLSRADEVIE